MGLPLYQAPIDSKTVPRPASDKNPAYARSSIRRTRLLRSHDQLREHRRRRVWAAGGGGNGGGSEAQSERQPEHQSPTAVTAEARESSFLRGGDHVTTRGALAGRDRDAADGRQQRAYQDLASHMEPNDAERIVAMFGDQWQNLVRPPPYARRNGGGGVGGTDTNGINLDDDGEALGNVADSPAIGDADADTDADARRRLAVLRDAADTASAAYGLPSARVYQQASRDWRTYLGMTMQSNEARTARRRQHMRESSTTGRLRSRQSSLQTAAAAAHRVDGLGDRNRSLSPENVNEWDTLQSTLTPDPQPPSVGSSFASTSASAVASQSGPIADSGSSSRTSATSPGPAEEEEEVVVDGSRSLAEPPCESGCDENSDTEGDEDEDMLEDDGDEEHQEEERQNRLMRFPSSVRFSATTHRSYADVVRSIDYHNGGNDSGSGNDNSNGNSQGSGSNGSNGSSDHLDDPFELFDLLGGIGGIQGMQRIVRNLARREEIPDEWWAEAGLSRTLSREA